MEIKRELYLNKLISKKNNGLIKVITGIRRCGKSYLLFTLFKNYLKANGVDDSHIIEIAFDSYEYKSMQNPEILYPYIKSRIKDDKMYYILLDEVQLLNDFEYVLNGLIRISNADVYVTGSNARFLAKDVITEFRGRGDAVHMYPLSFHEYMTAFQGSKEQGLKEYMLYGGLPFILSLDTSEEKSAFLKALFEETYLSDIINRHNIRNKNEMDDLLNILSSAIGSLTNSRKLSNTFKSVKNKTLSNNTIDKYIEYLCDSFLIEKAIRYDIKRKHYIGTPVKYYFTDMGIRNAKLNFRQFEETHAMENIIFNELKMRGYNIDIGVVPINEKNGNGNGIHKQLEIDFICNKGSKRYYIQSAYAMASDNIIRQEERPLMLTGDSFKKIIITRDAIAPLYNEQGILIMNIFDFLLDGSSLEQ